MRLSFTGALPVIDRRGHSARRFAKGCVRMIIVCSISIGAQMSQHCRLTGAKPGFGHHVSYSLRRTNLRFDVDVQRNRYWVPS